jgi:hypothetical protein
MPAPWNSVREVCIPKGKLFSCAFCALVMVDVAMAGVARILNRNGSVCVMGIMKDKRKRIGGFHICISYRV